MALESLIDLLKKAVEPQKSLMDRAFELLAQEEQTIISANRIAEKIAEAIRIELPKIPNPTPLIWGPKSITFSKHYEFFRDVSGIGVLIDFILISTSSSYKIKVLRDGEQLYDNTWTELHAITQGATNISAFQDPDNNYYYLILHNLNFNDKLLVQLSTTATITFSSVYYNLQVLQKE